MAELPSKITQIERTHAGFIRGAVEATTRTEQQAQIAQVFPAMQANGWQALVQAVQKIWAGERELGRFAGLDDEDRIVAAAILRGLQNPASLPEPADQADPTLAAPALAGLIHAAGTGDPSALQMLGAMGEQMQAVGGDMAQIAGLLRRLVNGERNAEQLAARLSGQADSLLMRILAELGKLDTH